MVSCHITEGTSRILQGLPIYCIYRSIHLLSLPDAKEKNNGQGDKTKGKRGRKQTKKKDSQLTSNVFTEWCQIHQQALETSVDCLTTAPILAYLDYEKDFILHVDASEKGLGALLYQEHEKVL